ncbi:hypothetical protein Hanom_Chr13g01215121 [Helianthus anomalus]
MIIRKLKRKFPADDDDDEVDDTDLPKVTSWSLDEQSRTVNVSYQHGVDYLLTMDEMLNTDRVQLLEQLCDLAHSNDASSNVVMIYKYRMQQRRNEIMTLYANTQDDESDENDEQIDGYISDVEDY